MWLHDLELFCVQAIYLDAEWLPITLIEILWFIHNTVLLRHIYSVKSHNRTVLLWLLTASVRIQNTFSKIQVLYRCKSSLCQVKFRVKSIYIVFFLSFHFRWLLFTPLSKGMNDDNLKTSCKLSKFIETLISRACWRGAGRHRTWEISIRRSCTNLIQIKLARYRYKQKQNLWTILRTTKSYRKQSQQTLH